MPSSNSKSHEAELNAAAEGFVTAARSAWYPIARSDDIGEGIVRAAQVLDHRVALWRTGGAVRIVSELCPHRGAALSLGQVTTTGHVRCPYHGWEFDHTGTCRAIPQLARPTIPKSIAVDAHPAIEWCGLVWTTLEPDTVRPTVFDRLGVGSCRVRAVSLGDWNANAARLVENFCDIAHFSILHADSFGDPESPTVDSIRVTDVEHQLLRFDYRYPARVIQRSGAVTHGLEDLRYEVTMPFLAVLDGSVGPGTALVLALCPIDVDVTRVFYSFVFDETSEQYRRTDWDEFDDLQERIWSADRLVVESQRPHLVPLDLTEELHLPFDRFAVAYRRALRHHGFDAVTTSARPTALHSGVST
jgi:phenylpropionate dioxygenase-like ring-hydroxylating dioxygenase large terminal subunit